MKTTIAIISALIGLNLPSGALAEKQDVWVAASHGGIYHGELNTNNGSLANFQAAVEGVNSFYIVKHPKLDVLYSVEHSGPSSAVVSYRIDGNSLVRQSGIDGRPNAGCHINVSADGKLLSVAYYNGGSVGVYSLGDDGAITGIFDEKQHSGKSVNVQRQEAPHPHWSGFSDDGRFVFVTDLGTDQIWVYKVEASGVSLSHKVDSNPGAGPRHLAFHPNRRYAYVSDELRAEVTAYRFEEKTASFSAMETLPAAEEGVKEVWANVSDIRVHPSGNFLYLVNRGLDRVSVFKIDQSSGRLSPVEREPIRGSISRNLAFDADGHWALVAGRASNTLSIFAIDQDSGELTYNRKLYQVPSPLSIVID
jgi:6-phosphogluconolactonase